MFLAHTIHETGGFQHMEELFALENPEAARRSYFCEGGIQGKSYHGRGLLQLSWPYNYKGASNYLGLEDQLLHNPEMVCQKTSLCIDTALWYWTEVVRGSSGVSDSNFWATTKAINGALESPNCDAARQRYNYYRKIAQGWNLRNIAAN